MSWDGHRRELVAFLLGRFPIDFEHAGKGNRAALEWTAEGGCPHIHLFISWSTYFLREGNIMGNAIDPEAAEPSSTQAFERDRNPAITNWNGTDSEGGQLATPASSESRVTQPGPAPSANAGLVDYDDLDSEDDPQDEAEREG